MVKKIAFLAVVCTMISSALQAAPFMSHNSRRAPQSLIVTGNYKVPRLMAATLKGLTSQPYLIMTADGRYFFVVGKSTREFPAGEVNAFINTLNLRRIVIIGDERYVTREQENMLRKSNIIRTPIVRIYGGDWGRVAEELDDMLNVGNLAREFRRNYRDHYMSDPQMKVADMEKADNLPASREVQAEKESSGSDELPAFEPETLN